MARQVNKHGLPRRIPSHIKREIRQRCGFGCVICGFGFYDYEHFDPDFVDAKSHSPEGMTLLCSQCNQKRARKRLSAATVAAANANPKCLQQGFTSELFDFGLNPIEVKFAGNHFIDCKHIIEINGTPILSLTPPKQEGQSFLISGIFTDGLGRVALTIRDNVWQARASNWDIECKGPRITVRTASGNVALQLYLEPEASRLTIERIDMEFERVRLKGALDSLQMSINEQGWSTISGCSMRSGFCGISIQSGPRVANDPIFDIEEPNSHAAR